MDAINQNDGFPVIQIMYLKIGRVLHWNKLKIPIVVLYIIVYFLYLAEIGRK